MRPDELTYTSGFNAIGAALGYDEAANGLGGWGLAAEDSSALDGHARQRCRRVPTAECPREP
jgi:hypothetical protein